jgi:hypothetical protein
VQMGVLELHPWGAVFPGAACGRAPGIAERQLKPLNRWRQQGDAFRRTLASREAQSRSE